MNLLNLFAKLAITTIITSSISYVIRKTDTVKRIKLLHVSVINNNITERGGKLIWAANYFVDLSSWLNIMK
jgi:hypothetical protein